MGKSASESSLSCHAVNRVTKDPMSVAGGVCPPPAMSGLAQGLAAGRMNLCDTRQERIEGHSIIFPCRPSAVPIQSDAISMDLSCRTVCHDQLGNSTVSTAVGSAV